MYPYRCSTFGIVQLRVRHFGRWAREKAHIAHCLARTSFSVRVSVAALWAPTSQLPPDASTEAAFDQMGDALKLIEKCAPFILCGMVRRNVHILIDQLPSPLYWPLSNTIHIPIAMVVGQWPIVPACTIVHEWTHARVNAAQSHMWSLKETTLKREEALCAKQQIDFVRRVPAGMFPHKASLITKIDELFRSGYWTKEEQQKSWRQWRQELGVTSE